MKRFLRIPLSPAQLRLAAGLVFGTLCAAAAPLPGDEVPGPGEPGGPTVPLNPNQMALWLAGRDLYDKPFTAAEGLGTPELNADSCRGCHQDPVLGGAGGLELNVSRFGFNGGGTQPFANLPGGQGLSKLRPTPIVTRENYPVGHPNPADNADVFEQRQTPTNLGIGLIDQIPDWVILANQDPSDLNGDGIFGVARILTIQGQPEVGRFGWKAQVPHIKDFVRDAMGGELGITTPDDGRGFAFVTDADTVADPELSQADTDAMIFFLRNLGPPIPNDSGLPIIKRGKRLFQAMRCDRCHIPELDAGPVPVGGSGIPIPLYSDLLLHDISENGFLGMAEPGAESGMFRTPPLWGVKDTAPYLHDGRAETLADAILLHNREARFSAVAFEKLTPTAKAAVIAFLESL